MNALSKRARFEEAAYANHQTEEFLARANSLRKLGEWAASQMMEENAPAIAAYADALVRTGSLDPNAVNGVADSLKLHGCNTQVNQPPSSPSEPCSEAEGDGCVDL